MGMLIRQVTGNNTISEVVVIDLDDGEIVSVIGEAGAVIAQASPIGGIVTLVIGNLPLADVTIRVENISGITAETTRTTINGGDQWVYTYGINLEVSNKRYNPGDVISISRMVSGLKEVKLKITNPNTLPLYDIILSLRQYGTEWGSSWVWLASDNSGEPGIYDKVIVIPQLDGGHTWDGWMVIQRDEADLPVVPGELARVYLDLTANPMLKVIETRTIDFSNPALYDFGTEDISFSSTPSCCDIDAKCAIVKSTGGATIDTTGYTGIKYIRSEQFEPVGTKVLYAFSVGNGWLVYNEQWVNIPDTDICIAGMDIDTIRTLTMAQFGQMFISGTFDIAVALGTVGNATPMVTKMDIAFTLM